MGHRNTTTPIARIGTLAVLFLATVLCCAAPTAGWADDTPAATEPAPTLARHAPSDVPYGYVITPFGYFHPSCVRTVGRSDIVLADGRVQHADGTRSPAHACGNAARGRCKSTAPRRRLARSELVPRQSAVRSH